MYVNMYDMYVYVYMYVCMNVYMQATPCRQTVWGRGDLLPHMPQHGLVVLEDLDEGPGDVEALRHLRLHEVEVRVQQHRKAGAALHHHHQQPVPELYEELDVRVVRVRALLEHSRGMAELEMLLTGNPPPGRYRLQQSSGPGGRTLSNAAAVPVPAMEMQTK